MVIVGGGPIGLACGIAASKAGISYRILEKGCLVNSLYNYPANMTFFSTAERLEIGEVPFTCIHAKPNRAEALEYYRRVAERFDLNIGLFEAVNKIEQAAESKFVVRTSKQTYRSKYVILATGFYDIPVAMNIPGEALPKVTHYYKDPHYYAFQEVIVVGGNNSAVDAALECWRKGAKVTMVMEESQVGERVKYWVRPDIVNRIAEGSIKAFNNARLAAIKPHEADIATPDGLVTVSNDFVIAMTGYQPNLECLSNLGVNLSEDGRYRPQYDAATMQTNVPGLYLAGVVCGGLDTHVWFIENSRVHADIIIGHIRSLNG